MISTTNLPAFPFARPLLPFLSLITQPPLPFPSSILPGTAPVCFPRRLPSFPLRPTTHSMRLPTSISPNQSLFSLLSCVTSIYCLLLPHPPSRLLSQWQPRSRPCVLQERGRRYSPGRNPSTPSSPPRPTWKTKQPWKQEITRQGSLHWALFPSTHSLAPC